MSIKGEPSVRQFIYSWEHPEFNVKVFLSLRYETYKKEWQDEVIVACTLQPKVDLSKMKGEASTSYNYK